MGAPLANSTDPIDSHIKLAARLKQNTTQLGSKGRQKITHTPLKLKHYALKHFMTYLLHPARGF